METNRMLKIVCLLVVGFSLLVHAQRAMAGFITYPLYASTKLYLNHKSGTYSWDQFVEGNIRDINNNPAYLNIYGFNINKFANQKYNLSIDIGNTSFNPDISGDILSVQIPSSVFKDNIKSAWVSNYFPVTYLPVTLNYSKNISGLFSFSHNCVYNNYVTLYWSTLKYDFCDKEPHQYPAVPEPGTVILFGLGFAGLGIARRCRREL